MHRHAQISLMFLSINAIQEVDGVLHNTVADIAVISSHLRSWGVLGNDNHLSKLGFQVHLVVPMLEKFPLDWLHWFSILLLSLFHEPLLGELLIFIFVSLSAKVQVFIPLPNAIFPIWYF